MKSITNELRSQEAESAAIDLFSLQTPLPVVDKQPPSDDEKAWRRDLPATGTASAEEKKLEARVYSERPR